MQVQLPRQVTTDLRAPAIAQVILPRTAIFAIAQNGMTQFRHMRAQLVGAAGDRLQRHPAQPCAQEPQGEVIGLCPLGIRVIAHLGRVDAHHLFAFAAAAMARRLHQRIFDAALFRLRHARNDSPIDLAGVPVPERLGQRAGNPVCAGQNQHTRRILVQPVHQFGPVLVAELQHFRQAVDVARPLARTALRWQARGLVQHDDMLVLEDDGILNHLGIGGADAIRAWARGGIHIRQRRHADFHAGRHPV